MFDIIVLNLYFKIKFMFYKQKIKNNNYSLSKLTKIQQ